MNEEEIDKQIKELVRKKEAINKEKEISQYKDHAKTILTKGNVDKNLIFSDLSDGYLPKKLNFNLCWRDIKYHESFWYDGLNFDYDYSNDDRHSYDFIVTKSNSKRFTYEELLKMIPDLKSTIEQVIENRENELENLKEALDKMKSHG